MQTLRVVRTWKCKKIYNILIFRFRIPGSPLKGEKYNKRAAQSLGKSEKNCDYLKSDCLETLIGGLFKSKNSINEADFIAQGHEITAFVSTFECILNIFFLTIH